MILSLIPTIACAINLKSSTKDLVTGYPSTELETTKEEEEQLRLRALANNESNASNPHGSYESTYNFFKSLDKGSTKLDNSKNRSDVFKSLGWDSDDGPFCYKYTDSDCEEDE